MFKWIRRIKKLWRAYTGKCPHCGQKLVLKDRKLDRPTPSGRVQKVFRQCPDAHFGIEYVSKNRVVVHDEDGEQIDILFHRNFKMLKSDDERTG